MGFLIQRLSKGMLMREYGDTIDIDLSEIREPLLACPNDPDHIKPLSEAAGEKIDEVLYWLMHDESKSFSAILQKYSGKRERAHRKLWISPPTRVVEEHLKETGGI